MGSLLNSLAHLVLLFCRRSKKPLGVIIQKLPNGFDDVNGYFPPSGIQFILFAKCGEVHQITLLLLHNQGIYKWCSVDLF